ncbi:MULTISPECIES: formate/nitrite transporter family protein [Halococcus]|uniref:Formate/nitrite transporter n=1 Tax=Halococcus salifodinae DSM 8989 TaxID=1227456 RepID=M0MYS4_9EURY|nr:MULTISPECIES: formate/nitrite transporter family protein [Halococcus]EMA50882.1 formate/nitrite transporter [Halococcus salifodinae DSM 8989]
MSRRGTNGSASGRELAEPVSEDDHTRGPDDASVTLVQYGDFECPNCGTVHSIIERLLDHLDDELRYVYRHFPLTEVRPNAKQAAEAAEAAGAQGAFWPMYDRLYEHQDALAAEDLEAHADALDLDTERFAQELDDNDHEDRVREDFESGIESDVNSAPTFFIDGERYEGRYSFDALLDAIVDAGDLTDVSRATPDGGEASRGDLRETLDESEHGAPAAGSAVRDRFSADEIFQRVVATADEEFDRSFRLLFLSGLAAGFAMSLSFVGVAALTALLGGDGSASAAGYLLYPLGFLFVVLGSYQLFTENTLTPVTLVLTRIASIPALLRVWGVVLAANVLGVAASAYVLANTGVLSPEAAAAASEIGHHFFELSWADIFWKGVFAGVLIAGMVWLIHAARDTAARVLIVFALAYAVGAAELAHCIVGSAETLYVVFNGEESLWSFFSHFLVPATLGNTVGGVVFVALLNYSQTRDRRIQNRDCRVLELGWSEWLFENHIGRPITPSFPESEDDGAEAD